MPRDPHPDHLSFHIKPLLARSNWIWLAVGAGSAGLTVIVLRDVPLDPGVANLIVAGVVLSAVFVLVISTVVWAIWFMSMGVYVVVRYLWRLARACALG
jgi:hypothetical protein